MKNLIQYLPLTHPKATMRFMKRLNNAGVMSILDLEDSAQDPFDEAKTSELKISSRNNFLEIAQNTSWKSEDFQLPIFVRVNDMSTSFFEEDIKTIIEISKTKFPISGIFLPKVSTYEDITKTFDLLSLADHPIEIVPMIETKVGMENLELLLTADTAKKFTKIHYGHFDYALDADLWPFPDPNHKFFWNHISPMIELIHKFNKTYIHTPFPFPKNLDLFWASSEYLLNLFPDHQPWIKATIITPDQYLGPIIKLCQDKRGQQTNLNYSGSRAVLSYELPLNQVVFDFNDRIKSMTSGYASFDYEILGHREGDLVKLGILVNGEPVDALAMMIHKDFAQRTGREVCEKLKDLIPRHNFMIPVQAAIGGKIIARETIKGFKKDVLTKIHGGGATDRKRKLLEKQKKGKARSKQFGRVEIPQEAFIGVLKISKD